MAATLLLAVVCGIFGAPVAGHLKGGGFVASDAESTRADNLLNDKFGGTQPNLIFLVTAPDGVASTQAKDAGESVVALLESRGDVEGIQSYWTVPDGLKAGFASRDKKSGLVVAVAKGDDSETQKVAASIAESLPHPNGVIIKQGGGAAAISQINDQITKDLTISEAVAVPISGLVLIVVFGSVIAAGLPLAIGLFAIVATLAILRALTLVTDVSIFALNMTTALGLALAIDYSLFIVSRFREELGRGLDIEAAVIRTVQTAGRTVLFSAITVALSLSAMLVFPMFFLKSFAYAGVAVVAAAALASILVLPAILILLGTRINSLDLRAPIRRMLGRPPRVAVAAEARGWYRMVSYVTRRAVPIAIAVVIFLLFLGSPFLGVKFGYPDDRVIQASVAESRQVGDTLRTDFDQNAGGGVSVVLPDFRGDPRTVAEYGAALSKVDDVAAVLSGSGVFVKGQQVGPAIPGMNNQSGAALRIATQVDPFSDRGSDQLRELRDVAKPGPALFTGAVAQNDDLLSGLGNKLPLAGILIAVTTLVLLFLFTGSVVLPLKALVVNTLSLSAAFGAMVWIFQDGHLSGLLGFTSSGYLVANMPILMFCLAFGLSMDYEVFLLSRIREEWLASDRTTNANSHAVAMGLTRTGPIVTAAAILMAIVLGGLAISKVSFIQLFGVGLAITVLVDATLIRCLLVPSIMRLMGRFNWWAPRPLRLLHEKIGLEEAPDDRVPART
ncbi:MMPL family transporter [Antrihabitans cavernicola]|uniref:MMPL family transporter n=1 Tax=Antrihabitans cavernicola TaxID=2495913 RepID=UPI00338E4AA8